MRIFRCMGKGHRRGARRFALARGRRGHYLSERCKTGPERRMLTVYQLLMFVLDVIWFVVIAHIIMSWLVSFQVLNIRQPLVQQIYYGLERLLSPIYTPLRR